MSNHWDELERLSAKVHKPGHTRLDWDEFGDTAGEFLTPERIRLLRAAEELAEDVLGCHENCHDNYPLIAPALDNYRQAKRAMAADELTAEAQRLAMYKEGK